MSDQPETAQKPVNHSLAIPVAIILGFGMIAGAIYFSGNKPTTTEETTGTTPNQVVDTNVPDSGTLNPITEDDHIRGNPNAPIMIVEYSDFDCPFCKSFHDTMNQIMGEYGSSGDVAWVYRHYPLERLHPSAPFIAKASECVAKHGDDESFWTFADLVFGERGTNDPTNLVRLPEFAEAAGVSQDVYQDCIDNDEEVEAFVQEDITNGASVGITGTPHSFILIGNQRFPLNGARPYTEMRSYLTSLLQQIDNAQGGEETQEEAGA